MEMAEGTRQFMGNLRANLGEKRSEVHYLLGCFSLERQDMASALIESFGHFSIERRDMASALHESFSAQEKARREAVMEMVEGTRQFMEDIRINLGEKRSEVHHLLGQFSLERRDMASAEERTRREAVMEMAEGVRASLGETASDLRQAHQVWTERLNQKMAPEAMVEEASMAEAPGVGVAEERVAEERVAEERLPEKEAATGEVEGKEEEILEIIARHAEGIRLVDIGNEMGVDWRALIGVTRSLVDSGRVEKIESLYYPKREASVER